MSLPEVVTSCNSPHEMRLRILQVLKQTEHKWRPLVSDFLPWVHKLQGMLPMAAPLLRMVGVDREQLARLQPLLRFLPASLDSWETDTWHLLNLVDDSDLVKWVATAEGVSSWVYRP
jgi:hypothetical protein